MYKILAVFFLLFSTKVLALQSVYVQVPAIIDSNATVPVAVKNQCNIEQLIGNQIFLEIKKKYRNIFETKEDKNVADSTFIELNIISVQSNGGGGGWSGPKSLSLEINIFQNGKIVNSTLLERSSKGGVLGPIKGTCAIYERIADVLASDTIKWTKKNHILSENAK